MSIDRMEILRLALASASDAREALGLAREMAAFVEKGGQEGAAAPRAAEEAPTTAKPKTINRQRTRWTDDERQRAAELLDQGVSYAEVGRILGRTGRAVQDARCDGALPCKTHTLNPKMQLAGALSALAQGRPLQADRQREIINGARQ